MPGTMIEFAQNGIAYNGYLAIPERGSGPALVVIQEWWGLVPHIKSLADRFAQAGFVALAPDFYKGETTTEPEEAGKLMMALNIGETEQILSKAVDALLARPEVGSVTAGVVGFCMGGQLALYAATLNPKVSATVDFYGIHPNVRPDLSKLNGPVLGLFAEFDSSASPEAVAKLDEELTSLGKPHQFHTYPGVHHAFFNDTRDSVYDPDAAADAWTRTLDFFRTNIQ